MKLLNMQQAMIVLGKQMGMTKENFAAKYSLTPVAQNGDGKGSMWFFSADEVQQRLEELKAKEAAKAEHMETLIQHPAAVAHRFVNADVIAQLDRIEAKVDRLLAALS